MRFTIKRLLFAVIGFAVPLACFRGLGIEGIAAGFVAGIGLSGLCLAIKRDQIWLAIRTALFVFGGIAIGLCFVPSTDPPHYPGCEINYIVPGGLFGFVLAFIKNRTGWPEVFLTERDKHRDVL